MLKMELFNTKIYIKQSH